MNTNNSTPTTNATTGCDKLTYDLCHIDQLAEAASLLLSSFREERFFAFFGSMGVGKTTLIKEICHQLGVEDNVCSPTFAIVNQYSDATGHPVYHFDFYRLKNLDEAYDIGYEEYFYSGEYCFTEWTEKIESLLPDRYVRIEIDEHDGRRHIEAHIVDTSTPDTHNA